MDEQRITQVVYNLVSNAIRFSPAGGHIWIRSHCADGKAIVEGVDSGRGLDPSEASRLFQPFVQVHQPDEPVAGGNGLGLYISKGIVEAHGGKLSVTSAGRGHGCTFWFEIPMLAPPAVSVLEENPRQAVEAKVPAH